MAAHNSHPLTHPKVVEDAMRSEVVWARVKGYPYWPVSGLRAVHTLLELACVCMHVPLRVRA